MSDPGRTLRDYFAKENAFADSSGQIHTKGLALTMEGRPKLPAPTLHQVHAAVDALTPRGGPGFLILDGLGGDYAQAAGGRGSLHGRMAGIFGPRSFGIG
jgi:hypothetical protein